MHSVRISLDPGIRNWVLFPLVVIVFCFLLIRHYVTALVSPNKVEDVRQKELVKPLQHAKLLENSFVLPPDSFQKHYDELTNTENGLLRAPVKNTEIEAMMNPVQMNKVMLQQLSGMLPNLLMMSIVSYFFSGVIIARVPFTLPESFRPMLQRGVNLPALDVSYVTSLSMYFLLLFGLRGVVNLVLGETPQSEGVIMPPVFPGSAHGVDYEKLYKQALEDLKVVKAHYKCKLDVFSCILDDASSIET